MYIYVYMCMWIQMYVYVSGYVHIHPDLSSRPEFEQRFVQITPIRVARAPQKPLMHTFVVVRHLL